MQGCGVGRGRPGDRIARLVCCGLLLLAAVGPADAAKKKKTGSSASSEPRTISAWEASIARAEERYRESWSVYVEDLRTGDAIYSYKANNRLVPASNRKLITMALALETLGPDFTYKTQFGLSQPTEAGRSHYHGDLVLRATGDPSLGFMSEDDPNPAHLFQQWAKNLEAMGIAYVHGRLIIDATAFGIDQNEYPSDVWASWHRNFAYAPVPSALALCQNLLRVAIVPGAAAGRAGRLTLFPSELGLDITNETRTVSSGSSGINAAFDPVTNNLVITGRINQKNKGEVVMVPLAKPLDYAGAVMRGALEQAGIRLVEGSSVVTVVNDRDTTRSIMVMIGEHRSPPLNRMLQEMMEHSNNFLAEQIWRTAAYRVTGKGDLMTARQVEQEWYSRRGMPWIEPGWDGSGISDKNKFASKDLAAVAHKMHDSPYRDLILQILPESGMNGTLRNKSFGKAAGRVTAKTGTLSDARALTGFINGRDGKPRWVFSVIGNGPRESSGRLGTRITQLMNVLIAKLDSQG